LGLKLTWLAAAPAAVTLAGAGSAFAADVAVPGAPCQPVARCTETAAKCAGLAAEPGNVAEAKSGRKFFLDYACGLKDGDEAVFILSFHGIGGSANGVRHYFPAVDYKDKYKLIIATPKSAGVAFDSQADDAYVAGVIDQVAKAFPTLKLRMWVAGHSAGGGYSRTWMCKPSAFSGKMVGSVSMAGNRLGGNRLSEPPGFREALARQGLSPDSPPPGEPPAGAALPPACGEFSHIYSTGSVDLLGAPIPEASTLAASLGCGARTRRPDIVDTKGGYVEFPQGRPAPLAGWGKEARGGTTEFYVFPNCRGGRVVADLIRVEKGHTEGLEPKVTEEIVKLVVAAGPRS
jgi:hypothetical protein